jgi:polysaccharide export outer membrane protein
MMYFDADTQRKALPSMIQFFMTFGAIGMAGFVFFWSRAWKPDFRRPNLPVGALICLIITLPLTGWCEPLPLVPTPSPLQASVVAQDDGYHLGAGDEIMVEDATQGALTEKSTWIGGDGLVDLPMLGPVTLEGLSIEQAQALLNRQYSAYFLTPDITIQVVSQHPTRVYIQGAVRHPGIYISGKSTHPDHSNNGSFGTIDATETTDAFYLTDALIQAGGLTDHADYTDIRIQRKLPQPTVLHINLWKLFKQGASAQDIPLQEHDLILVPSVSAIEADNPDWQAMTRSNIGVGLFQVSVIGSVQQPGSYTVSAHDSVLAAVAQAGGFSDTANQRAVYLLRANSAGQVFKKRINASDPKLMDNGKADWITLLPNDVIFVDNSPARQSMAVGRTLVDRVTGSALLPMFSALLRKN